MENAITIDTNEIRDLSPATIADRYRRLDIEQAIRTLGREPWKDTNEEKLAAQLLQIINEPPPVEILHVSLSDLAHLSPSTIVSRYSYADIKKAIAQHTPEGEEVPELPGEATAAAHLTALAARVIGAGGIIM